MTEEEFKKKARYLVDKYITDSSLSDELRKTIDEKGSSAAKGILHKITTSSDEIDAADGKVFKDIAFYFA